MIGKTVPTRQAVWPVDLIARRRAAVELETRIRELRLMPADDPAARSLELAALETRLTQLPCPHWDVQLADPASGEWACDSCAARITPTWVQLGDQESSLRRAAYLRSASRHRSSSAGAGRS